MRGCEHPDVFEAHEHADDKPQRDHDMPAAMVPVIADAAVSELVIVSLLPAAPLAGCRWIRSWVVGVCLIASPAYGLICAPEASWVT
jgi:hypothetical protein